MFKKLKHYFSEFTYYSSSARRATWVLIILILLSLAAPTIYSKFIDDTIKTPDSVQVQQFNKIVATLNEQQITKYNIPDTSFNPNLINESDWQKIGLDSRTSQNIAKYINKGGKFRKAEDILKIHGFDTSLYLALKPFMTFPAQSNYKSKQNYSYKQDIFKPIELNSADSIQLEALPGIGPKITSRILKYKNLLGGYYTNEQLLEVYGIDKELFNKIKNKISVNSNSIVKININTAQYGQLRRHPYIGKEKTQLILKLAKSKEITSLNELIDNKILNQDELKKLIPYLEL